MPHKWITSNPDGTPMESKLGAGKGGSAFSKQQPASSNSTNQSEAASSQPASQGSVFGAKQQSGAASSQPKGGDKWQKSKTFQVMDSQQRRLNSFYAQF